MSVRVVSGRISRHADATKMVNAPPVVLSRVKRVVSANAVMMATARSVALNRAVKDGQQMISPVKPAVNSNHAMAALRNQASSRVAAVPRRAVAGPKNDDELPHLIW